MRRLAAAHLAAAELAGRVCAVAGRRQSMSANLGSLACLYVLTGGPTPGGSQAAVCEALDLR